MGPTAIVWPTGRKPRCAWRQGPASDAAPARPPRPIPRPAGGVGPARAPAPSRRAGGGRPWALVLEAMGAVERHRFVDSALGNQAYEDISLPIGLGQTISKPQVVA